MDERRPTRSSREVDMTSLRPAPEISAGFPPGRRMREILGGRVDGTGCLMLLQRLHDRSVPESGVGLRRHEVTLIDVCCLMTERDSWSLAQWALLSLLPRTPFSDTRPCQA